MLSSFRAGEEFVALEEAIGAALGRRDAKSVYYNGRRRVNVKSRVLRKNKRLDNLCTGESVLEALVPQSLPTGPIT
jgi:hypothetical protein